ncbi:MAG TPA: SpoIID/LytB domain-containing protein, partial [Thermoanaerobaculia bacterium]
MRRLAAFSFSLFVVACTSTTPQPSTPTTPSRPPAAQPAPSRSANALTPVATMPPAIAEPDIRVGLLVDQASVVFPRTADGYYIVTDKGASTLKRGFTATGPLANATIRYAVQMAAISDQTSAQGVVDKVRTETGLRADMTFDPASGMYKILAGDFASSDEATPTRTRLIERGFGKDLIIVRRPSDQTFEKRIVITDDEGDRTTIDGAFIEIAPLSGETLTLDKQPYRTSARLFVNPRGLLNVINHLNLEDYLLGVVPAEMGPTIYDEVEALKAQAVAARTYALRNLGQFESEGYDICPGPACQAYKGFGGEHDMSTRAVRETAGLVMTHDGNMIDALYSATCGGETSDVGTMFPGRNEPYLKAVKCVELEMLTVAGRADSGLLTEQQLNARLFAALARLPETSSWSARDVSNAVVAAMRFAGWMEAPQPLPASSRRGDVLAYLSIMMALENKGRVLTMPEDRRYYFPQTANPEDTAHTAAAFLIKYGINPAQYIDRAALDQAIPREELYALLGAWLREHNLIRDAEGKILTLDGRKITLKQKGELSSYTLPAGIPIFRRVSDRLQEYANVPVLIGDRATIIMGTDKTVVAAIVQANYDGA